MTTIAADGAMDIATATVATTIGETVIGMAVTAMTVRGRSVLTGIAMDGRTACVATGIAIAMETGAGVVATGRMMDAPMG